MPDMYTSAIFWETQTKVIQMNAYNKFELHSQLLCTIIIQNSSKHKKTKKKPKK